MLCGGFFFERIFFCPEWFHGNEEKTCLECFEETLQQGTCHVLCRANFLPPCRCARI